jgi:hypothetical protein
MKKVFVIVTVFLVFGCGVFANVDAKILSSFSKSFPSAENIKWSQDVKGYFVSFIQHSIRCSACYDANGKFTYALRYYYEENLPVSVLMTVREKYLDKKIFAVTELSTIENVEYHIKLEDSKNWYGIKVNSWGDITIEEHFKRSDL